ncbi:MAG: NAD(P)-dependent dehydrogenase (short-subunit alcohol dehydrogenase family) [Cellvibrionaceae bacterium]|jgi:NAD(P)-dependent dehydrogenase (short-subunit alcohol dehydrogenase family)
MIDFKQYHPENDLLKNKIIAVTGAGAGIGRTVAKAYAKYGATVILLGRTVSKLESVYDEIEQAGYPQAAIIPVDFEIAEENQYQEIAEAMEENFGCLDGLLHNAALLGERSSIASTSVKSWQRLMQVNITAPFILTKKCLPLLQKSSGASIVFTGSSVGLKGRAYWGAYAVSKAANENLMQVLADELENTSKVRVNSINPGATRTQMRADAYPAENPKNVKAPRDLLPLYLYLMGKDSLDVNGNSLSYQ